MLISTTTQNKVRDALSTLALYFICNFSAHSEYNLKNEPIFPIPLTIELDKNKVQLGKQLFSDRRVSINDNIACVQCHQLEQGGEDGLQYSTTRNGKPDVINTPTIFNSIFNFRQTWRGAFKTLEQQAEADLKNLRHSATNWETLIPKLKTITSYKNKFKEIYPEGINRYSVLDAIATYEKSLITPNSRFDRYLRGNESALSSDEKDGYQSFKKYGCIACHQGINIGGNVFQKLGLFDDYFIKRGNITKADFGLYNVTGDEIDKFVFRVPSLRNIAVTSPYLHDGSITELEETVEVMAQYQLGTKIKKQDVKKIVLFLRTLTGEYKNKIITDKSE